MDKTIWEIFSSMNPTQKQVVYALLQTAMGDYDESGENDVQSVEHSDTSNDIDPVAVLNSLTEPQKEVFYILMDQALGGDKIKHSAEDDDDELMHHGVKGMKWGRRKSKQTSGSKKKKSSKKNPRRMSNKELAARIKRLDLEKRYMDAYNRSQTNKLMSEIFNVPTKAALFTGAVATTMANIDKIVKLGNKAAKAYKKRKNM